MPLGNETEVLEKDELTVLVHSTGSSALAGLLDHPSFDKRHACLLLRRSDLPADVLESIGGNRKWTKHEIVRLGVVVHAHTPRRIAMSLLRQLFAANLVRVALHPSAPAEVRCIAEELVIERVRQLSLTEKIAMARRGPVRVVGALLAEGHSDVLPAVLQSPFLTEAQVVRVLWRAGVPPHVVIAVAESSRWSSHYSVRLALVRNPYTPIAVALRFLPNLLVTDLRDLLRNGNVPSQIREHLRREVARKSGTLRT